MWPVSRAKGRDARFALKHRARSTGFTTKYSSDSVNLVTLNIFFPLFDSVFTVGTLNPAVEAFINGVGTE